MCRFSGFFSGEASQSAQMERVVAEMGARISSGWPDDFGAGLCRIARQRHPTLLWNVLIFQAGLAKQGGVA